MVRQSHVQRIGHWPFPIYVAVAEENICLPIVAKVGIRVALPRVGIDVVKLFEQRIVRRGRRLKVVHLRRIGQQDNLARTQDEADFDGNLTEIKIVAIAVRRAFGLILENAAAIAKRGTNVRAGSLQVGMKR